MHNNKILGTLFRMKTDTLLYRLHQWANMKNPAIVAVNSNNLYIDTDKISNDDNCMIYEIKNVPKNKSAIVRRHENVIINHKSRVILPLPDILNNPPDCIYLEHEHQDSIFSQENKSI